MKDDIVLKRTVHVSAWRVIGQIAKASKRAELVPILLRVQELGESNSTDIAQNLFFEARSRKVVAERLLRIAATYQLLEENKGSYTLTDEGIAAIENKHIFVPEFGAWTIWASDDPLLDSPIVRIEPWNEPSAYDEVWGKEQEAERTFERLSYWLRESTNHPIQPCAGNGETLRIDKLEREGEAIESQATVTMEWTLNPSYSQLRIQSAISGKRFSVELEPPPVTYPDVWRQLLEGEFLWESWDGEREVFLAEFDDTNDAERESMTRSLFFHHPEIESYGTFEPLSANNVTLSARSQQDADSWARWRLSERVREYASQHLFALWKEEAIAPFREYEIELPERCQLAKNAWRSRGPRPSSRVWHLVSAEDWGL